MAQPSKDREDDQRRRARRKQFIVGIIIGVVVGCVIAYFTQFWLWIPAGIVMGMASGSIMKPPDQNQNKRR
ncbi:MAG: HPP family protein [Canibacter sp.]